MINKKQLKTWESILDKTVFKLGYTETVDTDSPYVVHIESQHVLDLIDAVRKLTATIEWIQNDGSGYYTFCKEELERVYREVEK